MSATQGRPPGPPGRTEPAGGAAPLARFSARVLAAASSPRPFDDLVDALVELSGADRGLLLLDEGEDRAIRSSRAPGAVPVEPRPSDLPEPLLRRLVGQPTPSVHHDAGSEVRAPDRRPTLAAVVALPILRGERVIGLLAAGVERPTPAFGSRWGELLPAIQAQASLLVAHALAIEAMQREAVALREAVSARQEGELTVASAGMREVVRRLEKVAVTDVSVLVTGETGTGKEVVARELHRRSARAAGPFVVVNCAAIPEPLLESELFGHVKGAFTGATSNRAGRFQAASGGTLFLDEIGEMPPPLQVKLLRALQDRAVTRVGDSRPEPVDLRVISATHRDLEEEIRRGNFREDLFYRLNVVSIRIPPLRDRAEDLPLLARYFLQRAARALGTRARGLTPAALAALRRHPWPGNVRELENRIKKAAVLAERAMIEPGDLDLEGGELPPVVPLAQAKEQFQRRYIDEVLERNGGNRTRTARDLGVDPRTIFRHLERRDGDRGDEG